MEGAFLRLMVELFFSNSEIAVSRWKHLTKDVLPTLPSPGGPPPGEPRGQRKEEASGEEVAAYTHEHETDATAGDCAMA